MVVGVEGCKGLRWEEEGKGWVKANPGTMIPFRVKRE